jgi:hypothetical protein
MLRRQLTLSAKRNPMKKLVSAIVLVTVYLSMAPLAQADTLLGSQVTATGFFPNLGTALSFPNTQTVGPGIEFPSGSIVPLPGFFIFGVNIDVGATSIDFHPTTTGTVPVASFDGYVFDFSASGPVITGVSLDPLSTFTSSQVGLGFGPHQVTANFQGLSFTPSSRTLVNVNLADSAAAVPEPATWLLLGSGLAGLMLWRKRTA